MRPEASSLKRREIPAPLLPGSKYLQDSGNWSNVRDRRPRGRRVGENSQSKDAEGRGRRYRRRLGTVPHSQTPILMSDRPPAPVLLIHRKTRR